MFIKIFDFVAAVFLLPLFISVFIYYIIASFCFMEPKMNLSPDHLTIAIITYSIIWFFMTIAYFNDKSKGGTNASE